jgi:hypothetical protein
MARFHRANEGFARARMSTAEQASQIVARTHYRRRIGDTAAASRAGQTSGRGREVRALLDALTEQDLGYELGTNEVRPPGAVGAAVPEPLRELYAALDGVSMPDVHVGYFIDTAQRIMSAAVRGEPIQIVGDSERPIQVFGSDGGGGRFAVASDDGAVHYLPSSGAVRGGRYFEDQLVQSRRVAGSVCEFMDRLKADVRAFVNGDEHHRYLVEMIACVASVASQRTEIDPAIASRLEELQRLHVRFAVQTRDEALELIATMRVMSRDRQPVRQFDTTDAEREAVVAWLSSMRVDAEDEVLLVWPACSSGVRLRYADLANNYDALWYPSSDDVWVTDTQRRWLLELDHEEVFSWCELAIS